MNFSAHFIRHPVATSLLMAGIAMIGLIAYNNLPVSDLPNVDFPTISVQASLPGADPATMSSAVATPLERQFTTIAGIDSMTSTSSLGSTNITMQFDLSRDIDGAAVDVQTAIAAAMPLLPPGMPAPPSFRKVNPADGPSMFFALVSDTLPFNKLNEYAETTIAQRVSQVPGVAQVNVMGAQKYAVRVQVNPNKLASYKIGINEVANALRNWNVNLPTGTLWGDNYAFNVRANGQLYNAEAFKPVIVSWKNGRPVRLEDIATVRDGSEDERTEGFTYMNGKLNKGINLMVMRQPGSNVIEVNDSIKAALPQIKALLPPSMQLVVRSDRSKNIRESFRDTQYTMLLTLLLVVGVIFVFLRNISATLIPTLALPFSVVGTFAVMWLLDYSLDNLSMMAIILAIGFVVDDAIVMLENIVQHLERGESPMEAALNGSKEIWFTIISMTISLAAVFIPILFMGGVLGRLFREFAVTITVAVMISGFVSVSLTPMLASRMLTHKHPDDRVWFFRVTERFFSWMLRVYSNSLQWVIRYRWVTIGVFFVMLGATVWLFGVVKKGFIPETDIDQLQVSTEMQQGTSFEAMSRYQRRVLETMMQEPLIDGMMSNVGGGMFGASSNRGNMWVQLKPRTERKESAADIMARLRPQLSRFPGTRVIMSLPPAIRIGGRGSRSSYEFTMQAPDTDTLYRAGAMMEREIAKLPSVADVNSDIQMRSPRLTVEIDRDKAASLNVNPQEIASALYAAYGPSISSTIYAPTNQYRVMLEVQQPFQRFADMLSTLYLKSSDGQLVPLDAVTKRKMDVGPQSINHTGQLPSVTVSFNLKPGVALGEAVDEVLELAKQKLPGNVTPSFTGSAKTFQDSLKNLNVMLIVALLVVYIVLGVLYESFIHPLTILSGLPSAAFGALLTLYLFDMDLNIYGFVGLLLLIGLVKKNAIMQIDFALHAQRDRGLAPADAIYAGCVARFRPIMMTTLAAMFGAIPMAIGYGAGGEARKPLGMCVVGGLFFSQAMTLYLTPVVYIFLDGLRGNKSGKSKVSQAPTATEQKPVSTPAPAMALERQPDAPGATA